MKKPLAYRMRPKYLNDVIGQLDLVGPTGFLTNCLSQDSLVSIVLFGPPGTGKTTIAEALANSMNCWYKKLNAVSITKQEINDTIEECKKHESAIIIIDEIHRLPKDKQDLLLPNLEDGTFYLIGATTANPMLALNPAIRSRTHLLEVKHLTTDETIIGLKRAIISPDGLDNKRKYTDEAIETIAKLSGGDLRYAYNLLETTALTYSNKEITKEDIQAISSVPNYFADKDENEHYDTVSAFQKSIRGSDVNAAMYYRAKLIKSGDLDGIIRRLLVTAYEDVGLANPQAVDRCYHACETALKVGFPEASIPLGFTVADLALSPKSKSSTLAIEKAVDFVEKKPLEVKDYLKLTPVNVAEIDRYPYDRPDIWQHLQYLPDEIKDELFFIPDKQGKYEIALSENYKKLLKQGRSSDMRSLKKKRWDI